MWGSGKKKRRDRRGVPDTLVGRQTELHGDLHFSGGLHVDGVIRGNVLAPSDADAVLSVSDTGLIEGDVRVPHVMLNGNVQGNVHAGEQVSLSSRARVQGDVYYKALEMSVGAAVNGRLVCEAELNEGYVTGAASRRDGEAGGGEVAATGQTARMPAGKAEPD